MSVYSEARVFEAKLEFFNRQSPEIQAQLRASGYFAHDDEETAPEPDAA